MDATCRVVIVGGGFGGLNAAKRLGHAPVSLTLIDRRNFHLFQPLLYQVATGALSPGEIASPLRAVVGRNKNTEVVLGEVRDLNAVNRRLITDSGDIPYDELIVATGVTHSYFGHDDWAKVAPGLKTIENATGIRSRLLAAFEQAERETDLVKRREWLNFVIVGGGPTGVELAGALSEVANDSLRHDFHHIDPTDAHILLVEGETRLLPAFPPELSAKAEEELKELGVHTRTATRVTAIDEGGVIMTGFHGSGGESAGGEEKLAARTVLWAAGVRASRMGKVLAERAGAQLDKVGRVMVQPDLTIEGYPEIRVIGDLANFSHQTGKPLPGVAPVAIQQGRYAAKAIRAKIAGKSLKPFRYFDKGNLATIGRNKAVADFGFIKVWGFPAWFLWVFVHLMYLVEFENRLLVLVEWVYNYITRNRGARLITKDNS
jgi:NADH dehydrogenase